jgi:uroporphyrinogen III methyltransferase / synthase
MKPLSGVRIAVTRAETQSGELAEPLENEGADVLRCPLIRVHPYSLDEEMLRVLTSLDSFQWVIFTSKNGVDQFMRVVAQAKVDVGALHGRKIACVGPATRAATEAYGLTPDTVPDRFVGEAITAAMMRHGPLRGRKVLIARAAGGGQVLPADLRREGAEVVDLELYRSEMDRDGAARLKTLAEGGKIDLVTFTSGSAVDYFVDIIHKTRMAVAVIGPSTADVARARGLTVDIEANPHTIPGLVTAILNYYAARRGTLEV